MGTIRFILALSVALAHVTSRKLLGLSFLDADTAVQAFFLISGFYITLVLCQNPQYLSKRTFYASRYLRLWPVYAVCSLATLAIGKYAHYAAHFPNFTWDTVAFVIFSDLTLLFQDLFMFLRVTSAGTLEWTGSFYKDAQPFWAFLSVSQAWSIGIELVFYLMAPFIARRPLRLMLLLLFGLAVRFLVYRAMGWVGDPWHYRFLPAELTFFALGGLVYHWSRPLAAVETKRAFRRFALGVWAGVALMLFTGWAVASVYEPLMIKAPYFLLIFALSLPFLHEAGKRIRWDAFLGNLSYPIYMGHGFIASALSDWIGDPSILGNLAYIVCAVAFALMLERYVDRPVNRWRSRNFGARDTSKDVA